MLGIRIIRAIVETVTALWPVWLCLVCSSLPGFFSASHYISCHFSLFFFFLEIKNILGVFPLFPLFPYIIYKGNIFPLVLTLDSVLPALILALTWSESLKVLVLFWSHYTLVLVMTWCLFRWS